LEPKWTAHQSHEGLCLSPTGANTNQDRMQSRLGCLSTPQVLADVGEWFRRLTAADAGILYEDTYLQVRFCQN
jgi:hypothetical protein